MRSLATKLIVFASLGGVCGAVVGEALRTLLDHPLREHRSLLAGIWFLPVAGLTAMGIRAALDRHQGGGIRLDGPVLWSAALAGSGGFAAFFLGQLIYGDVVGAMAQASYLSRELFRGLMWAFAGALLGMVAGPEIPGFSFFRGVAGGLLGGMVGCGFFVLITAEGGTNELARLVGASIFGTALGIAMACSKLNRAQVYLKIEPAQAPPVILPVKSVPTRIGSGRGNSIVVDGLPSRWCAIRLVGGKVEIRDFATRKSELVMPGWQRTVNRVRISVVRSRAGEPKGAIEGDKSGRSPASPALAVPSRDQRR